MSGRSVEIGGCAGLGVGGDAGVMGGCVVSGFLVELTSASASGCRVVDQWGIPVPYGQLLKGQFGGAVRAACRRLRVENTSGGVFCRKLTRNRRQQLGEE